MYKAMDKSMVEEMIHPGTDRSAVSPYGRAVMQSPGIQPIDDAYNYPVHHIARLAVLPDFFTDLIPIQFRDIKMNDVWRGRAITGVAQHLSTTNGRPRVEFPDIKELPHNGTQRNTTGVGQHQVINNVRSGEQFPDIRVLKHHCAQRAMTGVSQHLDINNVRSVMTSPDMAPSKKSPDDDAQIEGQEFLCNMMKCFQTTKKSRFHFANSDIPLTDMSSIYESLDNNFDYRNGQQGFLRSLNN